MNITDRLSAHLTVAEFTDSDMAARLGIDNSLPDELVGAAQATGTMLERVRAVLGSPILVSSGYRCMALNTAIGSGPGSDHPKAEALDFRSPDFGTPLAICQALEPRLEELGIGQIIFEHTWVHISTRAPANPVNAVLTSAGAGYVEGIVG
jgi:zinc D-Ala-D-Ala carboxypeptidase